MNDCDMRLGFGVESPRPGMALPTLCAMDCDRHPLTRARLISPSLALSGCVYAMTWRDTSTAGPLSDTQRLSHFAASPFCGFVWTLQGDGWEITAQGERLKVPDRSMVGGPRITPAQFLSDGGLRSFMVVMPPEAWSALTGLVATDFVDRYLPVAEVLGPDWQALSDAMLQAADEQVCQALLEAFLLPRWRAHCAALGQAPSSYRDWLNNLGVRALSGGHGASVRQIERRIKQWSGQNQRALRRMARAEAAFTQVREEMAAGEVIWAALAQDVGYADQAHLCRETRRVTGFSPEELRRRIDSDEAFWLYRIWR